MEFTTWEPVYEAILADFGYGREGDERARDDLAAVVSDYYTPDAFDVRGGTVAVAGGGPSLEAQLDTVQSADAVFAASDAARRLREAGVAVDCMVTDLDKTPGTARTLTTSTVPVAVHAHGDNRDLLAEYVPTFDHAFVLPTTQAAPVGGVVNPGGFTDGDRAAFLADAVGAGRLTFAGWDFDDSTVGAEKARKLRWAERLLHWLERRRDERFSLLDGRRDDIEAVPE